MTHAELLKEQIKELHNLLALKDRRIAELEILLAAPRPIVTLPQISLPFISTPQPQFPYTGTPMPNPPFTITCDSHSQDSHSGMLHIDGNTGKVISK
jgi:hypothetical protein